MGMLEIKLEHSFFSLFTEKEPKIQKIDVSQERLHGWVSRRGTLILLTI